MSTIFSKIIAREVPADIVYESDTILAFLDIKPLQPGHTLVIPKEESVDGIECSPELMGEIMAVAQKIARVQKEVLGCDGVNFFMSNGAAAGQEVFHTHLHVIPRFEDDGVFEHPMRGEYEEGESEQVAAALAEKLK